MTTWKVREGGKKEEIHLPTLDHFSLRKFIELRTVKNIASYLDESVPEQLLEENDLKSSLELPDLTSTNFSCKEELLRSLVKSLAVLLLLFSCACSLFPANILVSKAIEQRMNMPGNHLARSLLYVALLIASAATTGACLLVFAFMYCNLLQKLLGVHSSSIKRSSYIYILWYVFDRIWHVLQPLAQMVCGGTIFYPWFYKCFGARVGCNNYFEDLQLRLPFMLRTGDNIAVEAGAQLVTCCIEQNGNITGRQLVIMSNAVIGPNTHIGLGVHLGEYSEVRALSVVPNGCCLSKNVVWEGNKESVPDTDTEPTLGDEKVASFGWHFVALLAMQLPLIVQASLSLGMFIGLLELLGGVI